MSEQRFNTSPTPHITVERCGGDLSIDAAATPEVLVAFSDPGEVRREGETLRVSAPHDCEIACPPGSSITLEQVGGDLRINDLTGPLAIQAVGGDVAIRGAGVTVLQSVSADLSARGVAGNLNIENVGSDVEVRDVSGNLRLGNVGGDLEVRRVEGDLSISHVGGDASVRDVKGNLTLEHVGGDASIETDLSAGQTYRISASGDLTLRVPPGASARFSLRAGGEIKDRVGLAERTGNAHAAQGTLGNGAAPVDLSAGGDLALLPTRDEFEFNFEVKIGEFEREMETKMRDLNEHIAKMAAQGASELEARLRRLDIEGLTRQAEQARQHGVRAAERARQQAERAAERARRRVERGGKSHGIKFKVDLTPPGAPSKSSRPHSTASATDAERMLILKMLEERKISADEASRLLEALGG
ncbi:MAG TPA: hypothetical protein VJG32_04400 [Anaerolineae bacterium]|nr:hypothetical protein [Anaerolineae bacterium]